jgi:transcriptional regulator of PTS gene
MTLNDRHVTLAIDLRPGKANLAVVDINGKILGRETVAFELKAGSTPEEARVAIAHIARAARALRAIYGDRLFQGLGVSVSGRVDQRTHRLLFSPNAPWGQIDLYAELQKVLEAPIEMENAANACLSAERWFGNFRRCVEHDRDFGFRGHRRGNAGGWTRGARPGRHGW